MPVDSSSTPVVDSAEIDSVPGTKRPCLPSSFDKLDIASSHKKPRSSDVVDNGGTGSWVNHEDFLEFAYEKLTSKEYFLTMIRGRFRVQRLIFFSKETGPSDHLIARLNELLGSFTDLLASKNELGTTDDPIEQLRLVNLTKQILLDWEGIENDVPQREPHPFSWWYIAPIDRPHAVPSPWLFEYHWRDMAYEEVLSLRKKYSYLLDQVYRDSYISYVKKQGGSGQITLSRKKLLAFLGSSREDIDFMFIEECYKRVMHIKELCIPKEQPFGLVDLCAFSNSKDQIQLPYWRDEIYEQVAASRKMYSLKLDELLRDVVDKMKSSGEQDEANIARKKIIEESLQFLANFRDGMAFLSEEKCLKKLAAIKQFMEEVARQSTEESEVGNNGLMNWRDLAYEQLQVCWHKFMYRLYGAYLTYKAAWSKMRVCDEDMRRLESHWERLLKFYRMSRGEMSLWSKKEYYDECWFNLRRDVKECVGLVERLLSCLEEEGKKTRWFCNAEKVVPHWSELCHRLVKCSD